MVCRSLIVIKYTICVAKYLCVYAFAINGCCFHRDENNKAPFIRKSEVCPSFYCLLTFLYNISKLWSGTTGSPHDRTLSSV